MNEEQKVTGIATAPDWAPDNCPPDVVGLIEDDQYLQDMGLRGLSSANSKEVQQAVRHLKGQFARAFQDGKDAMVAELVPGAGRRVVRLTILGYVVGVFCGAMIVLAVI